MENQSYNPKKALAALLNDADRSAFTEIRNELAGVEKQLADLECQGEDTGNARAAAYELDYRVNCTVDVGAVKAARDHLQKAVARRHPASVLAQHADGSFGCGTELWFLKLDRSTDQILARAWPWPRPPLFLQQINDPVRMVTYLQDLCWSDIARCRRDNRKELNLAISLIARLVVKGGQAGYLSGPGFYPAFERFVLDWQDPETGFFGVTYIIDDYGSQVRTTDLSLTFHMAHYVPHLVRYWPTLIDTLLAMRNGTYPQGWLDAGTTKTDHNNYDVAELFYRGWNHMLPRQRQAASEAVQDMLDWCLQNSVRADGMLSHPDPSDPIADSYYYAASFLDTIGYFDVAKRFWTNRRVPGDPATVKRGMIAQLEKFNPYYTEIDDALIRLGAREHPWVSAIF